MSSTLTIGLAYAVFGTGKHSCRSKRDMVGSLSQANVTVLSLRSANKI